MKIAEFKYPISQNAFFLFDLSSGHYAFAKEALGGNSNSSEL